MDTNHFNGTHKAFLYDSRSSAFPKTEKEYLLGYAKWKVTAIAEETLEYKHQKFQATVIHLL